MVSVPPEVSATRRAMSRPRPVDPPLDRPRRVGSASPKPGPSSAITSQAPPPARRLSRTAKPAPSGVCANTFPSRLSTQVARSSAATRTGTGSRETSTIIRRSWSSASGHQNAARSATTRAASQITSAPPPPGRRASRMISLTVRSTAPTSASSRSISAPSRSDSASIRSAVSGVRSRWDRSATVSRSCARSSPMRTARRFSPAPARRTSGGPVTAARADSSPAARRSEAWASAASGRTRDRASWSATSTLSSSRRRPTPPSSNQALLTPCRRTAAGTNARITAEPPASPSTATSTCSPPGASAEKLRPLRARRTASVTGSGRPSSAPDGRKTVTGVLVPALT